jgi:hypothetical protein
MTINTLPTLYVAEMHYPGSAMKRFRIVEKVITVDGPRDRLTSESFETLEEAERWIEHERMIRVPLGTGEGR